MPISAANSFHTRDNLSVGAQSFEIQRLEKLEQQGLSDLAKLPFSLRILLENLLRCEDGRFVRADDIRSLAKWKPGVPQTEIAFMPARVLLQDFTGVPAVVDFATMREAMQKMGGNPKRINPLFPAELVIDHSVQVDNFGSANAFGLNAELEFQRNVERYTFLRWGQTAFRNFKVVPPDTGICHQVNLEYLARVVCSMPNGNRMEAYPDSLVGTDSHTTMVNSLGVFGWGVGGIEAEAAMLGQPLSMLVPEVVGFKLRGRLQEGATATDLVLTVTEILRKKGVVGKFVEFYGSGLSSLSVPDRATIANMAPEYGATMGFFPVDDETLAYLHFTARSHEQVALVEAYCKEQFLFRTDSTPDPAFSGFTLHLVHAISSQFSKVRSFVFIDGIDEVTRFFESVDDVAEAVHRINTEADVVWVDGHSDYGHALSVFWERWGEEITPRSSVLLLGDARNNYHASQAWVVQEIRHRARHVYWLNPEPRAYWGTGDSILGEYAVHCDDVFECRNLRQLEHFVTELA